MPRKTFIALLIFIISSADFGDGNSEAEDYQRSFKNESSFGLFSRSRYHRKRSSSGVLVDFKTYQKFVIENPMVFTGKNNSVIRAHAGLTVKLPCKVQGDSQYGMITWARQLREANNSYQILTIEDSIHINDNRFFIPSSNSREDWSLEIVRIQEEDSGIYKCQANSHPPQFIIINLIVKKASAEIQGPKEKFIKSDSKFVLNCTFYNLTQKPEFVFWYQNEKMINHDTSRNIRVKIQRNYSTLTIPEAKGYRDSGNFTCHPANLSPDSVVVQILDEDYSNSAAAAVQITDESSVTNGGSSGGSTSSSLRPSKNSLTLSTTILITQTLYSLFPS